MPKYIVTLNRTEYLCMTFDIDAKNEDEAYEIAWDQSGEWECVDAEEFDGSIFEVKEESANVNL